MNIRKIAGWSIMGGIAASFVIFVAVVLGASSLIPIGLLGLALLAGWLIDGEK